VQRLPLCDEHPDRFLAPKRLSPTWIIPMIAPPATATREPPVDAANCCACASTSTGDRGEKLRHLLRARAQRGRDIPRARSIDRHGAAADRDAGVVAARAAAVRKLALAEPRY